MSKQPKKQDSTIPVASVLLTGTIIYSVKTSDSVGLKYLRSLQARVSHAGAISEWMKGSGTIALAVSWGGVIVCTTRKCYVETVIEESI